MVDMENTQMSNLLEPRSAMEVLGMKVMTPTIHLNGSNGESLKNDYLEAYVAAGELLDKLKAIDLNARDYYVRPGGQADFQQACAESVARYAAVKNIRQELETIILSIQEQQR